MRALRWRPVSRIVVVLAVFMLVPFRPALGNPISTQEWNRLNDLPFLVVKGGSFEDVVAFTSSLRRFGIDQPLLYRRKTLDFIDSNFDRLKPYFIESQESGLDEGIQAMFRSRGRPADREAMCRVLRHRLAGSQIGARVAEMLADWADTSALGSIDSLAHDPSTTPELRTMFERSAQRLRDPCSFGFLVPDGHGGIRVCRRRSDLVGISFVAPRKNTPTCTQPLDSSAVSGLWLLLSQCKEGKHARWFEGGWGIHFEFRDGLKADLRPTDSRWFNYTDTSKGGWWSRVIENPRLFEAVEDCLPERPLPHYESTSR